MNIISILFRKQPVERGNDHVSIALQKDIDTLHESIGRFDTAYNALLGEKSREDVAKAALRHRNDRKGDH